MHKLGALMAAVIAAAEDWNTIYFGADKPVHEIALARGTRAGERDQHFLYSASGGRKAYELKRLRRQFKPHVALLFGGGSQSPSHRS
jgi:hypothetical protein